MRLIKQENTGFIQQFWGKAPRQIWEKMINLMSKFGKINGIKHNNGSKIYPQKIKKLLILRAQVIKYHSDMGHCFS